MDALEEQLAQLKLMTSRTLSPRNLETNSDSSSSGGRGELVTTGAAENRTSPCQGSNHALLSSPLTVSHHKEDSCGTYSKKIGPAVPPKPWKRHQVAAATDLLPTDIRRKAQNPYSNMQMTLDNSVILDQQLEALEYHKKKIEQRSVVAAGIANRDNTTSAAAAGSVATLPRSTETDITTGAVKGTAASEIVPNVGGNYHLYSNVEQLEPMGITGKANPDAVVYSNIRYKPQHATVDKNDSAILTPNQNQIVYSNVGFGEQLPPPPPFEIPSAPASVSLTLDSNSLEYLQQTSEEDLPPPPSPVSSSYSELRRATDNFPQITQYSMYGRAENGQNRQPNEHYHAKHQTAEQTANPVDSGPTSSSSAAGVMHYHSNHPQQIYANAHYQNIYRPYEPNSQVTGGGSTSSEYGYGYADLCQSLSAYESIYEPINPRPPSQLSSRSNYLLYNSYVNGSQMTPGGSLPRIKMASNSSLCSASSSVGGSGIPVRHDSDKLSPGHKEAEVEALTNLLVHSMDSDTDIDSYGICGKCSERILGEASGCTAMDRIYHIDCFTCSQCGLNLQGKPFYAFDGEPYCEEDYLNTLEKCSVCMKPILERILRATGKPYHPRCFCCVVCGKSLDGIPFTVDATNQNYCIEDFHKKFAPRCCVCQEPIMPEPGEEETVRVVALDRSFHVKCYKCEDCGLLLSSEAEGRGCYPLDDHVLCKSCNAKRVQALTNRMTTEL